MAAPKLLTIGIVREAFAALDALLPRDTRLIVGEGTALFMAYGVPVRTTDVDAYPTGLSFQELDPFVKQVAREHDLPADWINPHYSTFAHVLPADYATRLRPLFRGVRLEVLALGVEDLLIMKCYAGREKDVGHARALLRKKPDLGLVERRLGELIDKRVPGALEAADFLDDLMEQEG